MCSDFFLQSRAAFVSVNLFSLLCVDNETVSTAQTGTILRYGGPILYLIVYSFILLAILVWVDSGSVLSRIFNLKRRSSKNEVAVAVDTQDKADVVNEAKHATASNDVLRVLGVSKTYGKHKVVDNVTLSASSDTIFALLGPNGAGKTTTFNIIRECLLVEDLTRNSFIIGGDVQPDIGDVTIAGESVIRHPKKARFALGVCPQFTAIDSQLTVQEHLEIYGRLKGLGHGDVLRNNVETLLHATGLVLYAHRLASKLSGGNQRKLSLAIALIGKVPSP